MFFVYLGIRYTIIASKKDYVEVETVCTNKKADILQFSYFNLYEFEPVDNSVCNEIITLSLSKEETYGIVPFHKRKMKIRIGYPYRLYLKNSALKKGFDARSFLGYERFIIEENDADVLDDSEH